MTQKKKLTPVHSSGAEQDHFIVTYLNLLVIGDIKRCRICEALDAAARSTYLKKNSPVQNHSAHLLALSSTLSSSTSATVLPR
mmetsp:Transcript_38175/g.70076  ORF Transcript_38175/g.70076 Transcript_38175/m.70076 type:complete len:83 (-) Transcript_38175:200-448(-)